MTLAGKVYTIIKENGEIDAATILQYLDNAVDREIAGIYTSMKKTFIERELMAQYHVTMEQTQKNTYLIFTYKPIIESLGREFISKAQRFFHENYTEKGICEVRYYISKIHDAGTRQWLTEYCDMVEANGFDLGWNIKIEQVRKLVAISRKAGYTGYHFYENCTDWYGSKFNKCTYYATR